MGEEARRPAGENDKDRSEHHRRGGEFAAPPAGWRPGQQCDRPYLDRCPGPDQRAPRNARAGQAHRGDGQRDGHHVEPGDCDQAEQRNPTHPVPGPGSRPAAPGPHPQHERDGQVTADGKEHEVSRVTARQVAGQPEGDGRARRVLPHRIGHRKGTVGQTACKPPLVDADVAVHVRRRGTQVKNGPRYEPHRPERGRPVGDPPCFEPAAPLLLGHVRQYDGSRGDVPAG
jgi:hypothetical protein